MLRLLQDTTYMLLSISGQGRLSINYVHVGDLRSHICVAIHMLGLCSVCASQGLDTQLTSDLAYLLCAQRRGTRLVRSCDTGSFETCARDRECA